MTDTCAKRNDVSLESRIRQARSPEKKLRLLTTFVYEESMEAGRQPCIFRPIGDEVEVSANRNHVFRPHVRAARELVIGCGAALFRFRIAVKYFGNSPIVRTFPDLLDTDLLALVRLGRRIHVDQETRRMFEAMHSAGCLQRIEREPHHAGSEISGEHLRQFRAAARTEGADLSVVRIGEDGSLSGSEEGEKPADMPALVLTTTKDLTPDHLTAGQALCRILLSGAEDRLAISLKNDSLSDSDWREQFRDQVGAWPQAILVPAIPKDNGQMLAG